MKTISFRAQLKGELSDFLKKEGLLSPGIEECLLSLVNSISPFMEEGRPLYPQVIICEDLPTTLRVLQGSNPISIGRGPIETKTIGVALKICAPLTQGCWVIFITISSALLEYGVFQRPFSPTALDIRDIILSLKEEGNPLKIILTNQLAEKTVELIGTSFGILNVHLSDTPDDALSPLEVLNNLIESCCSHVRREGKEQVQSFLRATLTESLRRCHGALIAVIPEGGDPKVISEDGVFLSIPVAFSDLVAQQEAQKSDQSLSNLTAHASLIDGALNSDGVVILDSGCRLIGYRLFVHDDMRVSSPDVVQEGGARHRAYKRLCDLVDEGKIFSCFIRSSNGISDYHDNER
jgi:hypothetical protein